MTLLKIDKIVKDYPLPRKYFLQKAPVFRALHEVSFEVEKGDSFGLVGESGCGKSTLARIILALDNPTSGTVFFQEQDLFSVPPKDLRALRQNFQMVFQDPYGSLNPRKKILSIVSEPLDMLERNMTINDRKSRVELMLREVGMNGGDMEKYPHEFSGGQRQRIAIARALITKPSLIVADESVSALDVSVQAQVLNLIMDLQEKYNLTFVFISHDLSVIEYITRKIAVIYLGRIVEQGRTEQVFKLPMHPYTQMLLAAIPSVDPFAKKKKRKNKSPGKSFGESSCPFAERCYLVSEICQRQIPPLLKKNGHLVACHNVNED
jgi:peptide/nickel transport system ATP-binding protein